MLIRLLVNVVALLAVFFLIWNVHGNDAVLTAVVMAVVLAIINAFIKPIVILLTLPATIVTLGLFVLVINVLLFYIAARLVHLNVDFWHAALGWLVFVLISSGLNQLALSSD